MRKTENEKGNVIFVEGGIRDKCRYIIESGKHISTEIWSNLMKLKAQLKITYCSALILYSHYGF